MIADEDAPKGRAVVTFCRAAAAAEPEAK